MLVAVVLGMVGVALIIAGGRGSAPNLLGIITAGGAAGAAGKLAGGALGAGPVQGPALPGGRKPVTS